MTTTDISTKLDYIATELGAVKEHLRVLNGTVASNTKDISTVDGRHLELEVKLDEHLKQSSERGIITEQKVDKLHARLDDIFEKLPRVRIATDLVFGGAKLILTAVVLALIGLVIKVALD